MLSSEQFWYDLLVNILLKGAAPKVDVWIELSPATDVPAGSLHSYAQKLPSSVKSLFEQAKQAIEQNAGGAQWDFAVRLQKEEYEDLVQSGIFGPAIYHHRLGEEYRAFVSHKDKNYKVALFITK